MAERIVTGIKQIDKALKRLGRRTANRAARAGLKKGARLGAKMVKAEVPSRLKSVRAAIGHSVKKDKKQGITKAKFGAAVGKSRRKKPPKRSTSAGLGIGRANLHWWILGTSRRETTGAKSVPAGVSRGKMPAHPVVQQAMRGGSTQIMNAIFEGTTDAIKRELEKLRRK